MFIPIWLRCEATNLGAFDLCHFALLKRGSANSGGFGDHRGAFLLTVELLCLQSIEVLL